MPSELRWRKNSLSVSDGTTSSDGTELLRNDADDIMHIRVIKHHVRLQTAAPNEECLSQISKAPAVQGDGSTFFNDDLAVDMPATGATPADGGLTSRHDSYYAVGQLTLEPGEAFYGNITKTSGGTVNQNAIFGYHF